MPPPSDKTPVLRQAIEDLQSENKRERPTGEDAKQRETALQAECLLLETESSEDEALLRLLFPASIPTDASFYEILGQLSYHLGFTQFSDRILISLWKTALEALPMDDAWDLWLSLPKAGHRFFMFFHLMHPLVEAADWPAERAFEWLVTMRRRIGTDGSIGSLWKAANCYIAGHPDRAVEILRLIRAGEKDEMAQDVAAFILARLRHQQLLAETDVAFRDVSQSFREAGQRWWIDCYVNSWLAYTQPQPFSLPEATELLQLLDVEKGCESGTSFRGAFTILSTAGLSDEGFQMVMDWVDARTPLPSDDARASATLPLNLVASWPTLSPLKRQFLKTSLLLAQPLPTESRYAWSCIDQSLKALLGHDREVFEEMFIALVKSNARGLIGYLESENHGELLEALRDDAEARIARMMLSESYEQRVVGLVLFRLLNLSSLGAALNTATDAQVGIMLCEFIGYGGDLAPSILAFLLMLAPRVEAGGQQLKDDFSVELLFQAKSYREGVLSVLKSINPQTPLVSQVVAEADSYFTALDAIPLDPITAIVVPGFAKAAYTKHKEWQEKIMRASWEQSVFANLMPVRQMLYTDRFASITDGDEVRESGLSSFGTSFEFPRLAMMDPDISLLRRRHAFQRIQEWKGASAAEGQS